MKPIIVCGVDFSGTSMLAGLLHAAGVDMGDVESAEDVAASDRPVRYRTFQDRAFDHLVASLEAELEGLLPDIPEWWLDKLHDCFLRYAQMRALYPEGCLDSPERKRWGVKCNGLMFLAMCEDFDMDAFEWLTTYRPLEDSMDSCFDKLGTSTRHAAMLAAEYVAWKQLVKRVRPWEFEFDDLLYQTRAEAWRIARKVFPEGPRFFDTHAVINPYTKGVIPCHGFSPEPHSLAPR